MSLTKSLLSVISALALATGVAFAGGGSMSHQQSYESSSPELLSDAEMWSGWSSSESSSFPMNGSESLAGLAQSENEYFVESDVIYIYPLQVTEYYVLVPSVDSETPMGG
jgi:ABC-type phosphate transport system substrate-binding protein